VGKGVIAEEACLVSDCGAVMRYATKASIWPDTVTLDVDVVGSKKISDTVKRAYAGAAASSGSVSSACVCLKQTDASGTSRVDASTRNSKAAYIGSALSHPGSIATQHITVSPPSHA